MLWTHLTNLNNKTPKIKLFQVISLYPKILFKNILRAIKIFNTQHGKIHNFWQPIKKKKISGMQRRKKKIMGRKINEN